MGVRAAAAAADGGRLGEGRPPPALSRRPCRAQLLQAHALAPEAQQRLGQLDSLSLLALTNGRELDHSRTARDTRARSRSVRLRRIAVTSTHARSLATALIPSRLFRKSPPRYPPLPPHTGNAPKPVEGSPPEARIAKPMAWPSDPQAATSTRLNPAGSPVFNTDTDSTARKSPASA